jgi:signal transduction histidine kinase
MTDKGLILVVDDEPGIREGCKRVLGAQDYQVDSAASGQECLRMIQERSYDLVLLDVVMPDVSGIDLMEPIHQRDPETVCIVITGYATVELAVKAIKQGAYDFINKPFSADDLVLAVNQGMERRRLSLEAKRCALAEQEAARLNQEKARLEEIDRAKMAYVRLVTHELRAPVAAIQNYLRLILDGYVPPERQTEILARAEARAREQLDLIADLLELSKLQDYRARDKVTLANLGDILREVVQQFEGQARAKDQQLDVSISCSLPPVRVAAEQFKSVWMNLISNALKYTPAGGKISVSLRCTEDGIVGEVSDTGIGIPKEVRHRIFTEFFRADNAKALAEQGTGLGLAIVKQIVEQAGGRIWFTSEEGRGSTFTFTLPITDAPPSNDQTMIASG